MVIEPQALAPFKSHATEILTVYLQKWSGRPGFEPRAGTIAADTGDLD